MKMCECEVVYSLGTELATQGEQLQPCCCCLDHTS